MHTLNQVYNDFPIVNKKVMVFGM